MKNIIKLVLLGFVLLQSLTLHPQSGASHQRWPPVGATWCYLYEPCSPVGYGCGGMKEYIRLDAIKDTTINDTLCTQISVRYYNWYGDTLTPPERIALNSETPLGTSANSRFLGYEYLYTSGNRVYSYHQGRFHLLYDFDLQVGDTIHLNLEANSNIYSQLEISSYSLSSPMTHIVVGRDSLEVNGRRLLYLDLELIADAYVLFSINFTRVVQGLGSLDYLTGRFFSPIASSTYGPLLSYSDSRIVFTSGTGCDTTTSSIPSPTNSRFATSMVYPNPIAHNSSIVLSNPLGRSILIEIFNSQGQLVERGQTKEEVYNLSPNGYPPGIYLYRLTSQEQFHGSGRFTSQ